MFLILVSKYPLREHDTHLSPVRLESYPNLKYLTYESYAKDFVLHYATRQLGSITSTCTLTQVTLDIGLDCRYHLDRHLCRELDDILMRERFKSLQNIILHRAISPELFPKLNAAGRLKILKKSASIDPPAKVYVWVALVVL